MAAIDVSGRIFSFSFIPITGDKNSLLKLTCQCQSVQPMDHHQSGRVPQARVSIGGCGGMLPQKILKIGSLKAPFSALSGRNMWQNDTENR